MQEDIALSPRQVEILKAIVEEYVDTALPVGSLVLEKKHNLGVSPATIRHEMAMLTSLGYLRQPHTSAGRVPTSKAMKFYVDKLMEEKEISVTEEVAAKQKVAEIEEDFDSLMHEVTRGLAQATHSLSIAATDNGDIWHAGYANILEIPEFYNIDVTAEVLSFLEDVRRFEELFFKRTSWENPVEIFFGEDLGWPRFDPVGIIASHFATSFGQGSVGIIGPTRLKYGEMIPLVRLYADLISETTKKWPKAK